MLKVRWEASALTPAGEAGPIPFEGELAAGWLVGLERQDGGGDSGRLSCDVYGTVDEQARMLAVALKYARERGFLPLALGYAELTSKGIAQVVIRGLATD